MASIKVDDVMVVTGNSSKINSHCFPLGLIVRVSEISPAGSEPLRCITVRGSSHMQWLRESDLLHVKLENKD